MVGIAAIVERQQEEGVVVPGAGRVVGRPPSRRQSRRRAAHCRRRWRWRPEACASGGHRWLKLQRHCSQAACAWCVLRSSSTDSELARQNCWWLLYESCENTCQFIGEVVRWPGRLENCWVYPDEKTVRTNTSSETHIKRLLESFLSYQFSWFCIYYNCLDFLFTQFIFCCAAICSKTWL
jgi:hypothetical protein